MSFVLDSSVSLAWCLEDKRTPATTALLHRVGEAGATSPQLWPLEALNVLMTAERRKRLDRPRRRHLAALLCALPVTLDNETIAHIWTTTQDLAERFRLTMYDAANLELAQRRALSLATLDKDLRDAGHDALGRQLMSNPSNVPVLFSTSASMPLIMERSGWPRSQRKKCGK